MSSINPYFTFNYVQPDEYHFSHDSVFLARQVFEILQENSYPYETILDLCSGCGIVGLDLLFHLNAAGLKEPKQIDFLEVQNIYQSYFEKNVATLLSTTSATTNFNFLNINYEDLNRSENEYRKKYDLIISNPPYFRKGQGVLSKSEFKNRCRFFLDSDFKNLMTCIENTLSENGRAFILLKALEEHGIFIEKEFAALNTNLMLTKLGLIRDTGFYELKNQCPNH